jgi:inorganic pyrophosphatase
MKVLGAICLLDQKEIDWKIVGINSQEATSNNVNLY